MRTHIANPRIGDRGVKVVKAGQVRNGIVLYGTVVSGSERGRCYTIKKKRTGKNRFTYYCTCDGNFLGEYRLCKHIAALKLVESQAVQNNGSHHEALDTGSH